MDARLGRFAGLVLTGVFASGGLMAVNSPAWSGTGTGSCHLHISGPWHIDNNHLLRAQGSRHDCSDYTTLRVRVRHAYSVQPDKTVASQSETLQNGSVTATAGCDGYGDYHADLLTGYGTSKKTDNRKMCY